MACRLTTWSLFFHVLVLFCTYGSEARDSPKFPLTKPVQDLVNSQNHVNPPLDDMYDPMDKDVKDDQSPYVKDTHQSLHIMDGAKHGHEEAIEMDITSEYADDLKRMHDVHEMPHVSSLSPSDPDDESQNAKDTHQSLHVTGSGSTQPIGMDIASKYADDLKRMHDGYEMLHVSSVPPSDSDDESQHAKDVKVSVYHN
ncbi:uncharacterized protein LOC143875593 [Tasmannia lanceolata]|uniref:uncharacterized protein LOC143875593 n=1 Tax=Tasmannia lanceolata TaxID=3420 RepID=UPI004063FBED